MSGTAVCVDANPVSDIPFRSTQPIDTARTTAHCLAKSKRHKHLTKDPTVVIAVIVGVVDDIDDVVAGGGGGGDCWVHSDIFVGI